MTNLVASAVEGLAPEAVSVVDMDGRLLSRPKKAAAADGSEITAESMEVRQQLERNLVAKISQTLEPLLGSKGFRAGASVDCDVTSGDLQEEVLDPARSVMLSSQKTEDVSDRQVEAGGVPGTASNLPSPAPAAPKSGSGTSRRTENITFQASRLVRHTVIPQGVIRRMSLAVLVDQGVRWEGNGPQKQRVLVPPAPETLKTIRDLVAGVTGFNADRGDQLIVETLPFESSVNAQPPAAASPVTSPSTSKDPPWLQFVRRSRDLWTPMLLTLVVLLAFAHLLFSARRRRHEPMEPVVSAPDELPAGAGPAQLAPSFAPAGQIESASFLEDRNQLADRVRHLARKDTAATANVLRMWMQETKS